mmetsp:Transcript_67527/g.206803  ORF Transcript_67527/g.206803 Transcript_67527/m.206803 type:complete len:292 (+) Transcript_67527:837-1712(+)
MVVALRVPAGQTSHLDVEGAIVLQNAVDLAEELLVVLDPDMLGHLDRRNHVVGLGRRIQVKKVLQDEIDGLSVAKFLGHPLRVRQLVLGHGDARDRGALAGQVVRQAAPTATDFQRLIPWLDAERMRDEIQLLQLSAPHRLARACVDRASVNHWLAQRGLEPVVALVVCLGQVVRILVGVVGPNARHECPEEAFDLDLTENWRVLAALQNVCHVTLARVDVVFDSLSFRRGVHVTPLLLRHPIRLEVHEADHAEEPKYGREDDNQSQRFAHHRRKHHHTADDERHPLGYEH